MYHGFTPSGIYTIRHLKRPFFLEKNGLNKSNFIITRNKFPIDPIMRVSDLRFISPSYYRKEQVDSNVVPIGARRGNQSPHDILGVIMSSRDRKSFVWGDITVATVMLSVPFHRCWFCSQWVYKITYTQDDPWFTWRSNDI